MCKVASKIRFGVLFGGREGFIKNIAVTFFIPKLIYEWPLNKTLIFEYLTFKLGRVSVDM